MADKCCAWMCFNFLLINALCPPVLRLCPLHDEWLCAADCTLPLLPPIGAQNKMYINIPCQRRTAALHALLRRLPPISEITVTRNSIARSVIIKLAQFRAKRFFHWEVRSPPCGTEQCWRSSRARRGRRAKAPQWRSSDLQDGSVCTKQTAKMTWVTLVMMKNKVKHQEVLWRNERMLKPHLFLPVDLSWLFLCVVSGGLMPDSK